MAEVSSLTEKQLRFAHEYVAEPNATQAYLRAFGGTYHTARNEGAKLLANPCVAQEIEAARRAWSKRCRVSFQRTVRALATIAFADPADLYEADPENCGLPKPRPWNEIPAAARKNIKSIKFKRRKLASKDACVYEIEELDYKVADKEWALGKLCEYMGVTKGSLTADDLRAILAADVTHANNHQAPPQVETNGVAAGVGGSDGSDDTVVEDVLDPDE